MAFSYDPSDLTTSTASGRLNIVRLMVGDTTDTDALPAVFSDEEVSAFLLLNGDSTLYAAAQACEVIAADHARFARRMERDGTTHEYFSPKELLDAAARFREQAATGTTAGTLQTGRIVSSDQEYLEERLPVWVSIYGTEYRIL